MGKNYTIITSENRNLTNNNLGLDIGGITNKSSPPVLYNKDIDPKLEYNPELDNACYDIYIYRLYLYRYSLDIELYRLC
jgi:hypothetical protein